MILYPARSAMDWPDSTWAETDGGAETHAPPGVGDSVIFANAANDVTLIDDVEITSLTLTAGAFNWADKIITVSANYHKAVGCTVTNLGKLIMTGTGSFDGLVDFLELGPLAYIDAAEITTAGATNGISIPAGASIFFGHAGIHPRYVYKNTENVDLVYCEGYALTAHDPFLLRPDESVTNNLIVNIPDLNVYYQPEGVGITWTQTATFTCRELQIKTDGVGLVTFDASGCSLTVNGLLLLGFAVAADFSGALITGNYKYSFYDIRAANAGNLQNAVTATSSIIDIVYTWDGANIEFTQTGSEIRGKRIPALSFDEIDDSATIDTPVDIFGGYRYAVFLFCIQANSDAAQTIYQEIWSTGDDKCRIEIFITAGNTLTVLARAGAGADTIRTAAAIDAFVAALLHEVWRDVVLVVDCENDKVYFWVCGRAWNDVDFDGALSQNTFAANVPSYQAWGLRSDDTQPLGGRLRCMGIKGTDTKPTITQVTAFHNNATTFLATYCPSWWVCNEGAGTVVYDNGGEAHMTLNGVSWALPTIKNLDNSGNDEIKAVNCIDGGENLNIDFVTEHNRNKTLMGLGN